MLASFEGKHSAGGSHERNEHAGEAKAVSHNRACGASSDSLFFFVMITAYAAVQIALTLIVKHVPKQNADMVAAGSALVLCVGHARHLYRPGALDRATKGARIGFAARYAARDCGVLFGFVLFCIVYAALWAMGIAHWNGLSASAAFVPSAVMAMVAAIGEELAIRGGVFRILEDSFGTAVALILSAGLFGAAACCSIRTPRLSRRGDRFGSGCAAGRGLRGQPQSVATDRAAFRLELHRRRRVRRRRVGRRGRQGPLQYAAHPDRTC